MAKEHARARGLLLRIYKEPSLREMRTDLARKPRRRSLLGAAARQPAIQGLDLTSQRCEDTRLHS